ncbi:SURF1 family protein [Aldersonia sp. NBC_00410]|uniref:SURF1 family cytochrome oxidase biogenesis protein n=1 Tax=Aldersonia sp. NBC_00410 TaxID=2975954 RepID=UPI00224E2DB6|nr:SURF1 family protein [Aldersonia sp. NBC_00410]MCX5042645.1 SURF1 family protein [Aldersonia sp. NBC_00410]
MRRLTFLLRPGWVILALLVAGFAYLCFSVLAPWQLGKNTSTSHRNDQIAASVDAEPVPVEQLVTASGPAADDDEWRRVTATGSYVPDSTVLVRLRSVDGGPAYEVLAVFRLDDGREVLVDRGYVQPVDGTRPPQVADPPTGRQTLNARLRMSEGTVPGKDPVTEEGFRQVYFVDAGQVGRVLGTDLIDGYLQLEADQPGSFEPIPLPQLDAGPYLSYGLQWLAFGIMAPLGLAYFVRAEVRERRKERAAARTAPSGDNSPAPDTPAPVPSTEPDRPASTRSADAPLSTQPTVSAKLADRYGKTR